MSGKWLIGLLAAIGLAGAAVDAEAVLMTRTYDFSANGFSSGAPVDPVEGSVTLTFDPAAGDVFGVAVDTISINIALTNPDGIVFIYFDSSAQPDTLVIYDPVNGIGNNNSTNDFFVVILDASTQSPVFDRLAYAQSGTSAVASLTGTVVNGAQTVPEPSALALIGFGLAGIALWLRRKPVAAIQP